MAPPCSPLPLQRHRHLLPLRNRPKPCPRRNPTPPPPSIRPRLRIHTITTPPTLRLIITLIPTRDFTTHSYFSWGRDLAFITEDSSPAGFTVLARLGFVGRRALE